MFLKSKQLRVLVNAVCEAVGKKYGNDPYAVHLEDVKQVLIEFGYSEDSYPELHCACEMHDLFEDIPLFTPETMITLGASLYATNLAFAVTDGPGNNRAERKMEMYRKVRNMPTALPLKLADRIANVRRSMAEPNSAVNLDYKKYKMYQSEHAVFKLSLYEAVYDTLTEKMFSELDNLFEF